MKGEKKKLKKRFLLSVYKENRVVFPFCRKICWQSSKTFQKVNYVTCSVVCKYRFGVICTKMLQIQWKICFKVSGLSFFDCPVRYFLTFIPFHVNIFQQQMYFQRHMSLSFSVLWDHVGCDSYIVVFLLVELLTTTFILWPISFVLTIYMFSVSCLL